MMYNRSAFKQEAKQLIRSSAPHFMLVALVYYLLTSGLSMAVTWLTGMFASPNPGGGLLVIFLTILTALFSAVMGIGFVNYSLRLARREPTGWNSLFLPFSYAGRAIGLPLMLLLFYCLWSLLILVCVVILVMIFVLPAVYSPVFIPLAVLGVILAYAGEIAALWFILLRYSMAEFALVDDPDAGVMESIRRSIRMMRGYKWKLFVMFLSFLGWEMLTVLIALIVLAIGFAVSNAGVYIEMIAVETDPEQVYIWVMLLMERLKYWMLLAEILALPLSLWLTVYKQTAMARFYNYVGGYDHHQYMYAQQNQQVQPPFASSEPFQPAPGPESPAPPSAGGYYTPLPDLPPKPEPPAQPEVPEPPETPPAGLSETPEAAPEEDAEDLDEEI